MDREYNEDLATVGLIMVAQWKESARYARKANIPSERSYHGAQASAIVHLAFAIRTYIPDFADYVAEFEEKGLM